MKRVITAIVVLLILLSATISLAAERYGELYATEPVYLRTGPSTRHAIILELQTGQAVIPLGKEGNWVKVRFNDTIGYVFEEYLTDADLSQTVQAKALARVNVREGAGTHFKSLGKLKKGELLPVFRVGNSWASIWWKGRVAYVHTDYLRFESAQIPSPNVPPMDPGDVGSAVATGNVNVRRGPGTSYGKLGKLYRGQTVAIRAIYGRWAEITWTESQKGYVHIDYLRIQGEGKSKGVYELLDILDKSKYFEVNRQIFIDRYITSNKQLGIRISSGADRLRVQDDLRRILGSSNFFLDTSALPSYVNAQYLNDLQKAIGEKVNNLTPAQFEQCPIASFGYDIWEDSFTVAIVGLDSNKISLFKQWVSDWGYFSFETASEIPKPKT